MIAEEKLKSDLLTCLALAAGKNQLLEFGVVFFISVRVAHTLINGSLSAPKLEEW